MQGWRPQKPVDQVAVAVGMLIFDDGYGTPTGLRYCMNSLSLDFKAE